MGSVGDVAGHPCRLGGHSYGWFSRRARLGTDAGSSFHPSCGAKPGGGRILAVDDRAARAFAGLVVSARRRGTAISVVDGQIAAIAFVHGLSVATRDVRPFEAAGLIVINPWDIVPLR